MLTASAAQRTHCQMTLETIDDLSDSQAATIRASWASVVQDGDALAHRFYLRLFHLAPSLRSLFPRSIDAQRRKLIASISMAVGAIGSDILIEELRDLGRRHATYGARPEHYPVLVQAMVWSLADTCEGWDEATGDAWECALTLISQHMLEGAGEVLPPVAS